MVWNKGLTKDTDERVKRYGEKHIGNQHWKKKKNLKGYTIATTGYILIYKPDHPLCDRNGFVFEHRLVMEKYIDRYLNHKEVVHHIDFNRKNNNINNLHLFESNSEHLKHHKFLEKCVREELKNGISKC